PGAGGAAAKGSGEAPSRLSATPGSTGPPGRSFATWRQFGMNGPFDGASGYPWRLPGARGRLSISGPVLRFPFANLNVIWSQSDAIRDGPKRDRRGGGKDIENAGATWGASTPRSNSCWPG